MKCKQLLISLATLSMVAGSMTAQEVSSGSAHGPQKQDSIYYLDNVTVLGFRQPRQSAITRSNVPLNKLPLTVSLLDVSQLQLRAINDIPNAVRFIPGANVRTLYGGFQQMSVRGFDSAPIMVDGMRDQRSTLTSFPLSDMSDVASIEMLKGPASVLQGQSAVGGILNITRRAPSAERIFSTRMELGSFGHRRATMSLGGELIGPFNYFASVNFADGERWRQTNNRNFKSYMAIGTKWSQGDFELRGGYHRDFYGTEIGLPPTLNETVYRVKDGSVYLAPGQVQPGLDRTNRYNNESDFMYNTGINISGKLTHRFADNLKLTEHLSYTHDDINYFGTEELSYDSTDKQPSKEDAGKYAYYILKGDKKVYYDLDHVRLTFPLRFSHLANTVQNQLSLDGSTFTASVKHNFSFGYSFAYLRRVSFSGYDLGKDVVGPGLKSLVDVRHPRSVGYMDSRFSKATPTRTFIHGLYMQDVLEFSEQLQAMAALRYDFYSFESARVDAIDGERKFTDVPSADYKKVISQALTYRVGLVYTPIESLNLYTSYANFYDPYRSFYSDRNIYINSQGEEFFPQDGKEVFRPKNGYQIEVGSRLQLGERLSAQVSGFYIHQGNVNKTLGVKEEVINGQKVKRTIIGQVGTIVSKGFDVEITAQPIEQLFMTAGYSLTDARYAKLKANKYLEADVQEGEPLNNVPMHKWYTYGNYSFDRGLLKGLGVHYSVTYTGKMYRNYSKNIYFDGYALCNVGATYMLPMNMTLGLEVTNLLNSQFYAESLGYQLVPNEPTAMRLSLTYRL